MYEGKAAALYSFLYRQFALIRFIYLNLVQISSHWIELNCKTMILPPFIWFVASILWANNWNQFVCLHFCFIAIKLLLK